MRKSFPKAPLIIDHCKYILSDSYFVNSIELKEKYTYKHTLNKKKSNSKIIDLPYYYQKLDNYAQTKLES